MKNTIVGLVGNELVTELERHLKEYEEMGLSSDEIVDRLDRFNDYVFIFISY